MNILGALFVAAIKIALGIVLAFVLVGSAMVLNAPYGGGGSGIIGLSWIVIIASVVWAISPLFRASNSARERPDSEHRDVRDADR